MPGLTATPLFATDGLLLRRVACDGVDEPRPVEEGADDARVILVLRGRFTFRDTAVRAVASPAVGLCLPDGHTYRIRHVDGEGDLCVALQGDLCRTLVASGPTVRRVSARSYLRVRKLAATLALGEPLTRLAVEETFCAALAPADASPRRIRAREHAVAETIAYEIERNVEARLALVALAKKAGVSVFHACRVFKQVTGVSIHRYHQEIRLWHALAWLLDSDRPIAGIAVDLGFANQGHLTNLFRRRFHTTPGRVRRSGQLASVRVR
jgi:AraC family transcriptional regulator